MQSSSIVRQHRKSLLENILAGKEALSARTYLLGDGGDGRIYEGHKGLFVMKIFNNAEQAQEELDKYEMLYNALKCKNQDADPCCEHFLEVLKLPSEHLLLYLAPRGLNLRDFFYTEDVLQQKFSLSHQELQGISHVKNAFKNDRCNRLNLCDLLRLLDDIIRAVSCLHDHGFAHCDIKPTNIIIYCQNESSRYRALLSDLVTLYEFKKDPEITLAVYRRDGRIGGTPAWMSADRLNFIRAAESVSKRVHDIKEKYDVKLDDRCATCRTLTYAMRRISEIVPKTSLVSIYFAHVYKLAAQIARHVSISNNMDTEWANLQHYLDAAVKAQDCDALSEETEESPSMTPLMIPSARKKNEMYKVKAYNSETEEPHEIYDKTGEIDPEVTYSFEPDLTESWFESAPLRS